MKIVILAAMGKELKMIEAAMDGAEKSETDGIDIIEGKIGNHDIIAAQCGIGKVNSAMRAYKMIERFSPDLVVNSGVAGGADLSMKVGTVLVADRIVYHDVWCGPGTEYGEADGCPLYFMADSRVVRLSGATEDGNLRKGLICTGDIFVSKEEEVRNIKSKFPDALAVDMESASIAQVCHMTGTPVAVIRIVSDTPGSGDNISQYKNFWNEAPEKSFEIVKSVISRLDNGNI